MSSKSLRNWKDTIFLEVFECIFFAFVHVKLIKVGKYSFKWFFTFWIEKKWSQHFLQNQSKAETEILAFYDIAPQPIQIQIRSASLNDRLDFSFLKDIHAIAKKLLERGVNRWFMSRKFDASVSIKHKNGQKHKKCIFCLFLSLCRTVSQPYRLSHINGLGSVLTGDPLYYIILDAAACMTVIFKSEILKAK